MCHDMRRFERMAEEKKRSKKEKEIDFAIKEIEEMTATSRAMKHRKMASSSSRMA